MATLAADPFLVDLTPQGMRKLEARPIVAGDDYVLRLKAENVDGTAVTLPVSPGLIIMEVKSSFSSAAVLFARRSDTNVGTTSTKQVAPDDQSMDAGTTGTTGRGWYSVTFGNEDAASMEAAIPTVGDLVFDVRSKSADGLTVTTLVRGKINFLRPATDPVT